MDDSTPPLSPTLGSNENINPDLSTTDEDEVENTSESYHQQPTTGLLPTFLKLGVASALLVSSIRNSTVLRSYKRNESANERFDERRRRLSEASETSSAWSGLAGGSVPTYMKALMEDLAARKKLFDETPPEEVKYWFEYTGPLQEYEYRYSKEREQADTFEGRDDSGVISSRFTLPGGGTDHKSFQTPPIDTQTKTTQEYSESTIPTTELPAHFRVLDNCFSLGHSTRPDLTPGSPWHELFAPSPDTSSPVLDRCRILVTLNTVGAGEGSTLLWETKPPIPHASGPTPWVSEQETAVTHLKRSFEEFDAMCQTGLLAVRVQILVCEPIPGVWTDWMDSLMPSCGGKSAPFMKMEEEGEEEKPSPIQVVVVANAGTADACHNLKSGFMEKRMQDFVLAPPYLTSNDKDDSNEGKTKKKNEPPIDPTIKMTHPDLVSTDDHDLYIGMKWSSLITLRSVISFLQASADLSAAASSPRNQSPAQAETTPSGQIISLIGPSSPFLIPSFVRVSYISEENNKVAKWRMHGDFFHPAAWEICKDSYDVTWIPDSLAGSKGMQGMCRNIADGKDNEECGQWWLYMTEEQMPTSPEVYANEIVAPLVQGGSNFAWMLTERHRREIVTQKVCLREQETDASKECSPTPQAVIPLGDMESFLVNFTPNSALGKKHSVERMPGYTHNKEREDDREAVKKSKSLAGQKEIEIALFDYNVYPAALMRKDATLKAARARDYALTKNSDKKIKDGEDVGPVTVKSEYYDVTVTKPRGPVLGWCMTIARRGLCVLYAEYFRESADRRCAEACGFRKNWTSTKKE